MQHVGSGCEHLVCENLLAWLRKITVAVPIDPGIEQTVGRGNEFYIRCLSGDQGCYKTNAVFIVGSINIIAIRAAAGYPVQIDIHGCAEVNACREQMPRSVARPEGRVAVRCI